MGRRTSAGRARGAFSLLGTALIFAVAGVTPAAVAAPAGPVTPASPVPATPPTSATPLPANGPDDACGGPTRLLATLNRPTVGYSACAVPAGALVLEAGYQNQVRGGAAATVTATYPQGFERFGLGGGFEVDALGPNVNLQRTGGASTSGLSDSGAGLKYEWPQRGRFTFALDGLFTPATGTNGFGAGGPTETLNTDVSYSVSPAIGVGTTLAVASSAGTYAPVTARGASATAAVAGRFGFFEPSLVVTAQFPHAYQFYAEFVAQTKLGPQQGGHVFGDVGVQKLFGEYVEVDVEYGREFTPVGGARFNYVGFGTGLRVR